MLRFPRLARMKSHMMKRLIRRVSDLRRRSVANCQQQHLGSKSGIRQHVRDHNCLQFSTENQVWMAACSMTHSDDGNLIERFGQSGACLRTPCHATKCAVG